MNDVVNGAASGIEKPAAADIGENASGADATGQGAEAGEAGQAGGAAAQGAAEADAPTSPADLVPRGLMEAQLKKLQSAKDREVAELKRQLLAIDARLPREAPAGRPEADPGQEQRKRSFDRKRALELADSDVGEAFDYLHKAAVQDAESNINDVVRRAVQEAIGGYAQQSTILSEYGGRFDGLAQRYSLSEEEYQRATDVVRESLVNNVPTIEPERAILMARFGSMEAAMEFAARGYQTARAGVAPTGPVGPAAAPKPPLPPPVPGAGQNNVQTRSIPDGAGENRIRPGAYRGALR